MEEPVHRVLLMYPIGGAVLLLAILVHHEALRVTSYLIPRMPVHHRFKIFFVVIGCLIGHIIEIFFFGVAYYALAYTSKYGSLQVNLANPTNRAADSSIETVKL